MSMANHNHLDQQHPPPPPQPPSTPPLPPPQPPSTPPLPPSQPPHLHPGRPKYTTFSTCASCTVATFFLIILASIITIACSFLFRPEDPKIAVNSIKFPAISLTNNTVDFTFQQHVAVQNPNRYSFSHYDSSVQLYYLGNQIGFMFIPAGEIGAGRTQYVSATFNVRSIPVDTAAGGSQVEEVDVGGVKGNVGLGATMLEVETRMKMCGMVSVLKVLAHHVESRAQCSVTIDVRNGNVSGLHCK